MPQPKNFLLEKAGLARLSHISLEVADLDRALDFYREVFGMQIVLDLTLDGPDFEAVTATPGARSFAQVASTAACRADARRTSRPFSATNAPLLWT